MAGWVLISVLTIKVFQEALADCQTVIWNGPMGVFEFDKFAAGTNGIATTLAELSARAAAPSSEGIRSLLSRSWPAEKMSHISTGGGASSSSKARFSPAWLPSTKQPEVLRWSLTRTGSSQCSTGALGAGLRHSPWPRQVAVVDHLLVCCCGCCSAAEIPLLAGAGATQWRGHVVCGGESSWPGVRAARSGADRQCRWLRPDMFRRL